MDGAARHPLGAATPARIVQNAAVLLQRSIGPVQSGLLPPPDPATGGWQRDRPRVSRWQQPPAASRPRA